MVLLNDLLHCKSNNKQGQVPSRLEATQYKKRQDNGRQGKNLTKGQKVLQE
jgi:hypothetical protein